MREMRTAMKAMVRAARVMSRRAAAAVKIQASHYPYLLRIRQGLCRLFHMVIQSLLLLLAKFSQETPRAAFCALVW